MKKIPGNILFPAFITSLFALLRLPSVSEPYWYGDEGIYEVLGKAMNQGRILYLEIWDNKPPLLYVIYAIFNGEQFYVRLASLIAGILAVIVFFLITQKLFKSKTASYISTAFFAVMFGLPVVEGNIANAENFMVPLALLSFYILFCSNIKNKFFAAGLAGFILSLSFLIKIVAVFDVAAFAAGLFFLRFMDRFSIKGSDLAREVKKLISGFGQEAVFLTAFTIPVILCALYFFVNGAFPDFFRATFSQNVGYVGYGNHFIIPLGFVYLKFILLALSIISVFILRKRLGFSGVLICTWLFASVANSLFSQRPYTHYLLIALPAVSLYLGYILDNKKILKFTLPLGIIILLILMNTFKLNFRKAPLYYMNYVNFVTGQKSAESYTAFFDRNTIRDYEIVDFIKTKTQASDGIFIWGDSAQIYALSGKLPPGRYTVSYHITFYKDAVDETKEALSNSSTKYIIQIKDSPEINNFLEGYELRYILDRAKIYERRS